MSVFSNSARNRPSNDRHRISPSEFDHELRSQVDQYFESTGLAPYATAVVWSKGAIFVGLCLGSYVGLVFWSQVLWQVAAFAVLLALGLVGITCSIQHDGSHGAYARASWVNRLAAYTLDLIGGSSYVWKWRHVRDHHRRPNAAEIDNDIDATPFLRLAAWQRRRWFHRWQYLYAWLLYCFVVVRSHFLNDFWQIWHGCTGKRRFPRPRGAALAGFIVGKIWFFGFAFVVPALFHPLWAVVVVYLSICAIASLILVTVIQLGHCLEDVDLRNADLVNEKKSWSEYQLAETANFAPRNYFLIWFCGGLNYQIEHHLFPRISHAHYPAISPIIQSVCLKHGIRYLSHPTMRQALRSHINWLWKMGRDPDGNGWSCYGHNAVTQVE